MAITPAPKATPRPRKPEPETDVNVVARDEEYFIAEIFGEEFRFSTFVNPWLMLMITTGENTSAALLQLLHSIIEVDIPADATEAEAEDLRQAEAQRFSSLLGSQGRGFTFERLFRLVNDLIETAGNETPASAGD